MLAGCRGGGAQEAAPAAQEEPKLTEGEACAELKAANAEQAKGIIRKMTTNELRAAFMKVGWAAARCARCASCALLCQQAAACF